MSKLRAFFEYLLDNVFDIATILIAGFLVLRQQLQPSAITDFSELATWVLGVLGLIAVSGLWERNRKLRRIEDIAKEGRDLILRRLTGKAYAKDFFLTDKVVSRKAFESADVIYVSGMTLTRTTRTYAEVWEERLKAGATIKIMILEIDNDLLKELILRSSGDTNIEYWKNKLQASLTCSCIFSEGVNYPAFIFLDDADTGKQCDQQDNTDNREKWHHNNSSSLIN